MGVLIILLNKTTEVVCSPEVTSFRLLDTKLDISLVQVIRVQLATNLQGVKFYVGWMRSMFVCDSALSPKVTASNCQTLTYLVTVLRNVAKDICVSTMFLSFSTLS